MRLVLPFLLTAGWVAADTATGPELFRAIRNDDLPAVRRLVRSADVNTADAQGATLPDARRVICESGMPQTAAGARSGPESFQQGGGHGADLGICRSGKGSPAADAQRGRKRTGAFRRHGADCRFRRPWESPHRQAAARRGRRREGARSGLPGRWCGPRRRPAMPRFWRSC